MSITIPKVIPHGIAEIRATYGDITVQNGRVIAPLHWEDDNMALVTDLPLFGPRRLYVHKLVVDSLRAALQACADLGDGYQLRTFGCFNPRPKRVNGDLSVHSWGAAVDLNADTNPLAATMGAPVVKDIPDAWIAAFKAQGFTWGGDFQRPDPMHFQLAIGY